MRQANRCPVCDGRAGRVEETEIDGKVVLRYWHTDLVDRKEFCIEYPNGDGKQVYQGEGEPTGPRRRA